MGKKILIVEDEEIIRNMYSALLSNHGYTVLTASDGVTGLNDAFRHRPDLILLDLKMPHMDGMTMLKNLRTDEWGAEAKVIILTNMELNDGLLSSVVENQPTYYLIKSNTKPQEVLTFVNEVVGPA